MSRAGESGDEDGAVVFWDGSVDVVRALPKI